MKTIENTIGNNHFTKEEEVILRKNRNYDSFVDLCNKKVSTLSEFYGIDENSMKKYILKNPRIVRLNNDLVMKNMKDAYGFEDEDKIKKNMLKLPSLAGLDHNRVIKDLINIYGESNEERIKRALRLNIGIAGVNHERSLKDIKNVYKKSNEDKIIDTIFRQPSFIGMNHYRVLRDKIKIGKLFNINKKEIEELILSKPEMSGCSFTRDLAILDIVRELNKNNLYITKKQVINNFGKSPYIPNTKKLRISKARKFKRKDLSPRDNEEVNIIMPPMYEVLKKTATLNNQYIRKKF